MTSFCDALALLVLWVPSPECLEPARQPLDRRCRPRICHKLEKAGGDNTTVVLATLGIVSVCSLIAAQVLDEMKVPMRFGILMTLALWQTIGQSLPSFFTDFALEQRCEPFREENC